MKLFLKKIEVFVLAASKEFWLMPKIMFAHLPVILASANPERTATR